jgi:amino acid adenylation domain-containing protein
MNRQVQRQTESVPGSGLRRRPGSVCPGVAPELGTDAIEPSIPERFEKQVAQDPGRLAVKSRNHELTYAALNEAANRVAHALLARRGPAAEPVAVFLRSDAPMVAALLGILKAGKMYVPLDPSHPVERNAAILAETEAASVVTDGRHLELARATARRGQLVLNMDDAAHARRNDPGLPVSSEACAWILYTSGSTGRPKGVVQTHRNALHFVRTYTAGLGVCAEDRLALVHSFCVNAGNHDIFTGLLNGASLFPLDLKEEGVAALPGWLEQHQLTLLHAGPTVFRHLVKCLTGDENFPHLRLIWLGGELLYARDVELYKKRFSAECVLVNRLGSTETGTIRWFFMNKKTPTTGNPVPVGYAAPDNEILLVDAVPDEGGQMGEIAVRSQYLAPGYWGRPDLTRAAFQPDPDGGSARVYRTGDIGRLMPDGCLICLGRKDSQVKIRGYRIEVGEVESALLDLPDIKEAAVVSAPDSVGDHRLVAYIVLATSAPRSVSGLRRALAIRLPAHMLPTVFVHLDVLPKAPNGKLDRRALPAPGRARPTLDQPPVAPRTSVETALCAIWREVLDLDEVGVTDAFLDLGGTSLAAGRILARLAETFRVDLPLRLLFEAPTVAGLAAALAARGVGASDPAAQERLLGELEGLSEAEAERLLAAGQPAPPEAGHE